jgi:phosphatidylserine decarboxylase
VIFLMQILLLATLLIAVVLWLFNFPYPSPLVRWMLPPRSRWPEDQIRDGLRSGSFPRSYLEYFYRDPERTPPSGDGILAPADGIVTSVDVHNGVRYLVIALSFWDMHVQYSPLSGTVVSVQELGNEFMDGEGRNFAFLREKPCPVQKRVAMQTELGEIAIRLITSLAARRIQTFVAEGDSLRRGQRIGRILLGSTVVLELPEESLIRVALRQRVRACETVVADLNERLTK